jgi:uncharacterized protein
MTERNSISRRTALKGMASTSALAVVAAGESGFAAANSKKVGILKQFPNANQDIVRKVWETPLIDTHEHLIEEQEALAKPTKRVRGDDWSVLMSHYLDSDFLTAGMPKEQFDKFFSPDYDPVDKWKFIEPYWPFVKNTGYAQAVQISMKELYGVDELSAKTVRQVQTGYERVRRPGFYQSILRDYSNIESCQVNCVSRPFCESAMPTLLMQDIHIRGMFDRPNLQQYAVPTGIQVKSLSDWYQVINWWFDKYAKYAVAAKSANAYSRNIDYEKVPVERVERDFKDYLDGDRLPDVDKKALEDHLFWYAVKKSTENKLPVKLHTGYYAGQNINLPLARLSANPAAAAELCRQSPETAFIFMHIGYPYYEEMIPIAKHFTNAHMDMCWGWIINPVAAKDFLKKYLVTAPANKILTLDRKSVV